MQAIKQNETRRADRGIIRVLFDIVNSASNVARARSLIPLGRHAKAWPWHPRVSGGHWGAAETNAWIPN